MTYFVLKALLNPTNQPITRIEKGPARTTATQKSRLHNASLPSRLCNMRSTRHKNDAMFYC